MTDTDEGVAREARSGRFLDANATRIAPDPNSGCWLWDGSWDHPSGAEKSHDLPYGSLTYRGRKTRAHRLSFTMDKGAIPEGLIVRHKCDVSVCVNPDHLELGTHQDNVNDMLERGRIRGKRVFPPTFVTLPGSVGELNGMAKLTASEIGQIRSLRAQGESCQSVADRFGISKSYVSKVARGIRWLDGLPTATDSEATHGEAS